MNFEEVLYRAQTGDKEAVLQILEMFRPLLIKNSLVNGRFDEDLYQELRLEVLKCIRGFGRNIYSYGSNKEAARLSGINTRVTVYGVYVFCAVVCGIAGILLTSRLGNGVPTSGDGYELDAIAAAVVGGASLDGGEGSVIGTVLGAMIMAMLRQGGTLLGINSFIMEIIIGSLIALAVVIDKIRRR